MVEAAWFRGALACAWVLLAACSDSSGDDDANAPHAGAHAGASAASAGGVGGMGGSGTAAGSSGMSGSAARAGQGGNAGASNAGSSGTAGGTAGSTAGDAGTSTPDAGGTNPPGLVWPNDESQANSDPWLAEHHDEIVQLQPRVLVIDLEATQDAETLVDRHIRALEEASSFHKYKDANAEPALAYKLVKVVQASKGARIDYASWNTQGFADDNLQIKDPEDPSGPNLTLCGLFERGIINEVWCMASRDPKCGETQEYKQVYNEDGSQQPDRFASVSNGDNISGLGCAVTVRITDFNSGRGTGCHQHAMGHAWERYMEARAVPQLGKQARRFLNWDLDERVGAPFQTFYQACDSNSVRLTDCIVWESNVRARSGPTAGGDFDIADMSEGCGNAHFYPNTTGTYSYDVDTPDPEVLTSCENYGLHNGDDGKDLTTPYTNAMTDELYGRSQRTCPEDQPACDDDCGGHGTTYLYQNFPGPGTQATNDDGSPMHNWWVYLFY